MRTILRSLFVCLPLAALSGCGEEAVEVDPEQTVDAQLENRDLATIRDFLQSVAQTGEVATSGLYGMDESLKKAGKPELVDDLNKLGSARGDQAKKIAEDMLKKLDG